MNAVNMYSGKLVQFRLETSANRDYVQKAFREEEDLYRGVQKLQAATPSELEYSGNSRIDMTLGDCGKWDGGLEGSSLAGTWTGRGGFGRQQNMGGAMTYKERYPEKATGSDWI